jgi:hypothetical protein
VSKANLDKKPAEVAAMFDEVAPTYDLTNALLSFGQDRFWRRVVRKQVAPKSGQKILDLAAGTGASSAAFLAPGVKVIAGDFSEGMLAVGRKRHPEIDFVFADAPGLEIPYGMIHFSRTPTQASSHVNSTCDGGVLHLQNFNFANFIAKQLWYQLNEVVFNNYPYFYVEYKYLNFTKKPTDLISVKPRWIEDFQQLKSESGVSQHWQFEIAKRRHIFSDRCAVTINYTMFVIRSQVGIYTSATCKMCACKNSCSGNFNAVFSFSVVSVNKMFQFSIVCFHIC